MLVWLNILWFIMVLFIFTYLELYLNKHIKIKLLKSFIVVSILTVFVIVTILFTRYGIFDKKVNNICFIILIICSGYIIYRYKAIRLELGLNVGFYIIFLFIPLFSIISPLLNSLFPFDYWFWLFYLISFVFLDWILEYDISKRVKIISPFLLFLGVALFLLNNAEYWPIFNVVNGNLMYKATISLLFQYFPMILFIWILFYQNKEKEKTETEIKELEKKIESNYFRNSRRYFFRNQRRYKRLRKIKYH
jgi:hypothetical protein